MTTRNAHEMWIEQCAAAQDIKFRYGVKAAFDYLVAEKLLYFASAAATRPELASELPRFVAQVRGLFTPQEIRTNLARIEREHKEDAAAVAAHEAELAEAEEPDGEEDEVVKRHELDDHQDLIRDSRSEMAEFKRESAAQARQFALVKALLTAAELGTA